jgi:hypothetical protein
MECEDERVRLLSRNGTFVLSVIPASPAEAHQLLASIWSTTRVALRIPEPGESSLQAAGGYVVTARLSDG